MTDLLNDLQHKMRKINQAVARLATTGRDKAQAEQDYRIALAKRMFEERERGTPVTIIGDLCRGDREIAKLKFMRDTADAVYNANQEAINVWKIEIRVLEAQIAREWGRTDYGK